MNENNIQASLAHVEMPSRYLGNEVNSVKKDLSKVDLKFALAFPDLYEIGTSHFGMQILYTILNQKENIAAERFFTPATDMERVLKQKGTPLFSLESKVDLADFDIIGFSLLYELNFTNILTMLDLSNIPFYAKERDDSFPLIIGGGPCAFNPEPLADFFDALLIGDGEEAVIEISETYIQWKKSGDGKKQSLLKLLSKISGVYVPSFFTASFNEKGIQSLEPLYTDYTSVKRATLSDLAKAPFPISPIVPFGKPVHDRLRLEIARGCSRGCRFCQAGMIYRPVRERSVKDLLEIAEQSLKTTGYSDISLLSLSTGDYGELEQLMTTLLSVDSNYCTAVSLPSIRAGRLTPQLMKIIRSVRKTGFTIAPEAGTQRLRDVINKNITEADIFDTVTNAFELGWRNIKLYFMHGLPTETEEDIDGICDLAKRLAGIKTGGTGKGKGRGRGKGKGKGQSNINVSFVTFIPKAHTPFQRCSQLAAEKSMENLNYLKQNLRHPGINLKWQDPEMSLLEGVFARGDRRLAKVLVKAWEKGCRLDGWSDMFRFDLWEETFSETGTDPLFYTSRERGEDESLPWAHIDCGVSDEFMQKEYEKAVAGEVTPDCREDECSGCGVCDFEKIEPLLHASSGARAEGVEFKSVFNDGLQSKPKQNVNYTKFRFYYEKLGAAKYLGHLELANIIKRAIRRTGIKVKYSMGFHPDMKLSFDNPLPVGMESEEEFFNLYTEITTDTDLVVKNMNISLKGIIAITRCIHVAKLKKNNLAEQSSYKIFLKDFSIDKTMVEEFMNSSEYIVEQVNFKGKKRVTDLRKAVVKIELLDSSHLEMVLTKYQNRTVRPAEILTRIFNVPDNAVQRTEILKLRAVEKK
ncbi:MAG: TIGR03960 family B12-binding radical SAM protein [Thermodesulfobacteriota bacterium]|nr:TIGR03960 family B12-binding radical SAM protein [Thermodesulfobacteriota bacterium]